MMVDGQRVKRSNMYDMEGGERSVWDQELGADQPEPVAPTIATTSPGLISKLIPRSTFGPSSWYAKDTPSKDSRPS